MRKYILLVILFLSLTNLVNAKKCNPGVENFLWKEQNNSIGYEENERFIQCLCDNIPVSDQSLTLFQTWGNTHAKEVAKIVDECGKKAKSSNK